MFGLDYNLVLMSLSFPLLGIFQVFVFIPIIPEIFERLVYELDIHLGEDEVLDFALNDKCNDTYGMIYALSMFAAPLIGGNLSDLYGGYKTNAHQKVADIFFFIDIVCFVVLFVFNGDIRVFKENRIFQSRLGELQPNKEGVDDIQSYKSYREFVASNKFSVYSNTKRHFLGESTVSQKRMDNLRSVKASIMKSSQGGSSIATSHYLSKSHSNYGSIYKHNKYIRKNSQGVGSIVSSKSGVVSSRKMIAQIKTTSNSL